MSVSTAASGDRDITWGLGIFAAATHRADRAAAVRQPIVLRGVAARRPRCRMGFRAAVAVSTAEAAVPPAGGVVAARTGVEPAVVGLQPIRSA